MIRTSKLVKSEFKNNNNKKTQQRRFMATITLNEPVIVSAVRTPIGAFNGALSGFSASQLGAFTIKAAIERINLDPKLVQEVYMGNVIASGMGQAPARQAAIFSGLPTSTICTTVNKVCASGMKSVMLAAQSIMLGQQDIIVAGGMESMSNVPYYLDKARGGYKYGNGTLQDGILKDGLTDVYNNFHMGMCAEDCAKKFSITREEQDKYAIESYKRAAEAWKTGAFKEEVIPIKVPGKKGDTIVEEDEGFRKVDFDRIPALKPAFDKNGTVTAANASTLNDGATALVIMSAAKAKELGLKPLAKIVGFGDAEQDPIEFPTAPAKAIPKALAMANLKKDQIDYWEINEAFSVVALANRKLLDLDLAKLNVNGGGVSLGHPIGSSGARIVTSLYYILKNKGAKYGCASICNGGGGGSAIVIEKL